MAELLADKLSNLHGGEPGTALLMTVAQMQADDETPPALRNHVEFRVAIKEKV